MALEVKIVVPDATKDRAIGMITTRGPANAYYHAFSFRARFEIDCELLPINAVAGRNLRSSQTAPSAGS